MERYAACLAAVALAVAGCGTGEAEGGRERFDQPGLAPGATLGGFTGAAAGGTAAWGAGGMILGALFGTYLGQRVDEEEGVRSQVGGPIRVGGIEICFQDACVAQEDTYRYAQSTDDAFLNEPVGSETSWRNPATGSHGTTTITGAFVQADGTQCKEFTQRVSFNADQREVDGVACQAADGTWEVWDIEPQFHQPGTGRS
jgi:surface antigen